MIESSLQDQIDAALAYEKLFVPALFEPWAARVADAGAIQSGQKVLDIASGTGVLAREVVSRIGPSGQVIALDPNPGMLSVAQQIAPNLDCQQGLAESLPFEDETFDAVVSQFGLMFFNDRRQALREAYRVLVRGGHMAVAVWDGLDNIPLYAAAVALLEKMAGEQAADALRAPFVLGDRSELEYLFNDAGIDSVTISTHRGTARFPDLHTMVEADLRGWLPVMGVNLPESQISQILDAAEQALGPHLKQRSPAVFDVSAHIISGVSAH